MLFCIYLMHLTSPYLFRHSGHLVGFLCPGKIRQSNFWQTHCAFRVFLDKSSFLPSGKRLHNYGTSPFVNGETHYFDWAIFNSYAKLPESNLWGWSYGLYGLLLHNSAVQERLSSPDTFGHAWRKMSFECGLSLSIGKYEYGQFITDNPVMNHWKIWKAIGKYE